MSLPIHLYNTRTRSVDTFTPLSPPSVTMYNCGPTVYNFAHVGNLRAYVFADVLRRTLEWNGYTVHQVINITDVGHLVSDADEGEDKMTVGAKREGRSVEEIIARYSDAFYADLEALNILAAKDKGQEEKFPRATHHIAEQIALIETLSTKGYTYVTGDGIYFDTSKFPSYPDFARLDISGMQAGARVDLGEKQHSTDFALWKFSPEDGGHREQEWDSPLGIPKKGFPGWHIECSAMARKYLGETLDIHTGGIDHIPVHHTNEIAQSECATGKTFARWWMHSAFMNVDGQKMSKSLGNTYTLADLAEHGISPLAFRYWLLTAHYRTQVNFTWEALEGAQQALSRMRSIVNTLPDKGVENANYVQRIAEAVAEDLDTPRALALLWECLRDDALTPEAKRATFVRVAPLVGLPVDVVVPVRTVTSTIKLGLTYAVKGEHDIPKEVEELLVAREDARKAKQYTESDRLRDEIRSHGYDVKDTPERQVVTPI